MMTYSPLAVNFARAARSASDKAQPRAGKAKRRLVEAS